MSRRAALALILLAVLARVGYEQTMARDTGAAGALAGHLLGDERAYDRFARQVAAGGVERTRAFYQEPLYAYLVGQVYKLWPPPDLPETAAVVPAAPVHRAIVTVQHLLGVVIVLLTAALGTRAVSARVGVLAGALMAVSGPLIFHESMLLKASLSLVVFLGALLLWCDRLEQRGGWLRTAALGACLGAGALLRGNLFLLLGLVLLSLLLPFGTGRRRPGEALLVLVTALLLLAPVTLHNLSRGELVLSTYQAGSNAAIGQPPGSDATRGLVYEPLRAGRGDAWFEEDDAVALAEAGTGRTLSGREISAWWWAQVAERVAAEPLTALKRAGLKLLHLFHGSEVPDVKEWSFLRRAVPWLATPLSDLTVLGPLSLLGLLLLPWRRRPGLLVLRGGVLVVAASLVLFYVMGRYRLTALPCLLVAAAGVLERWWTLRRQRPLRVGAELTLAAALVTAGWALPLPSDPNGDHVSLANAASVGLARCELATDAQTAEAERQRAVAWARQAVEIAPAFPAARRMLVRCLSAAPLGLPPLRDQAWDAAWRLALVLEGLRTGEGDAARRADGDLPQVQQDALQLRQQPAAPGGEAFTAPLLAWAWRCVAQELREPDDRELALSLVEQALRLDDSEPLAHVQHGLLLRRLGRLSDAEAAYRRALAGGAHGVELFNNLGTVLLDLGRPREAEEQLLRALELQPGDPTVLRNLERARQQP